MNNRGKLLVALALNKAQREKIDNYKKVHSGSSIKRRKRDPDFTPSSDSDSSSNSDTCDFKKTVNTIAVVQNRGKYLIV